MPFYTYNPSTGELLEISEQLLHDGCPPTGCAITFTNLTMDEINTQYTWDVELRDFVLKQ